VRHKSKGRKLGRDSAHRKALFSNLTGALVTHGRIKTTLAKAKEVRPIAERMVTLGKRGDLHARRQAKAFLRSGDVVHVLFAEAAPVDGGVTPEAALAHGMENFPIEELELGVRSYNCLKRVGIETIGDLVMKTEQELAAIPNFGKKSIEEVRETLSQHGLHLRGENGSGGFE